MLTKVFGAGCKRLQPFTVQKVELEQYFLTACVYIYTYTYTYVHTYIHTYIEQMGLYRLPLKVTTACFIKSHLKILSQDETGCSDF